MKAKIVILGNDLLRQKSEPVEKFDDELKEAIDAAFVLMRRKDGVGMAAPQIGLLKRFFVINVGDDVDRVFVNPQIVSTSVETECKEEGCLSVPDFYIPVTRSTKVTVQAQDENGKPFTLTADGLLARAIQHEYDHLNGVLMIDKNGDEARAEIEKRFQRQFMKKMLKRK
ncbi:MAG: peptide deformylase [Spirochaetaceae bacterium]|nr:peptide deformylase [Spirochaetaceae bacterium]